MNPEFVLDSSACIPILRNRARWDQLPDPSRTAISVIVAGELWTGVKKNIRTHPHKVDRLEAFLSYFKILDFDFNATLHYADIRAALEAQGQPIGPLDLLIAAHARSIEATLVTDNQAEFKRVPGLKILAFKAD